MGCGSKEKSRKTAALTQWKAQRVLCDGPRVRGYQGPFKPRSSPTDMEITTVRTTVFADSYEYSFYHLLGVALNRLI